MKKSIFMISMILILCLTACGQQKDVPKESGTTSETAKSGKLNVLFMSGVYADSARSMTDEFKE